MLFKYPHSMHQSIDELDDEYWAFGSAFDFDFVEDEEKLITQNPDCIVVKRKTSGHTCAKCREFYPYAEASEGETFKCWGCRNF